MRQKDYTLDLIPLIKALCGVEFTNIEFPRVNAWVNRRIKRAYRASNYWTRFLGIGEQRNIVNSTIPYTEVGLDDIDTYLRVHVTAPFIEGSSQEYDFTVTAQGAKLIASETTGTAYLTYKKALSSSYGDGMNGSNTQIPDEWFEYIAHGVYADYLRAEGQQDKASFADQEADMILQDELMKLDDQVTLNIISTRLSTHANRQYRN